MYITRFPINSTRRSALKMLANPYIIHAALAGSFPPDGDKGRVLWRVDTLSENKILYVVSSAKPSLVGLDEQIGWPDMPAQWQTRDYSPFLGSIANGSCYSFRLVANPVINKVGITSENGRSKRVGHLTALQQSAWLIGEAAYKGLDIEVPEVFKGQQSRAQKNGFDVLVNEQTGIPEMVVSESRKRTFKQGKTDRSITISTARFDGILKVNDADALRTAMTEGIGHAKGFGCGLLTLAPIDRK